MWIRHNNALYNSNDIAKIEISKTYKTKLRATFHDGSEVVLGEFKTVKECEDIFRSVMQRLLAIGTPDEGIMIKDTKEKK